MTTSTLQEMMLPMYNNSTMTEMVVPAAQYGMVKAESGLTYAHHHNNLPGVSRKRSREDSNNSINMNHQFVPFTTPTENLYNNCGNNNNYYSSSNLFSFLGQDFSSQIQLDQVEVDRCISHHMEKVRLEMEERRRKYSRNIMALVEESTSKKLKAKEEEILKIEKLNSALVDRVKSLYVENQLWRDLAQSNEATATALRTNLEQVLTQVRDHHHHQPYPRSVELIDDAQSCCGSNYDEGGERRNLADNVVENNCSVIGKINGKICRSCGKEEACVLVLPCRHLCLCSGCDSYVHICPVCESNKSCSHHVNLTT